jgi:hypothetical protein
VSSTVCQGHDLPGFGDVLSVELLDLAEQLAVAIITDQRLTVLLKQLRERPLVLIESRACRGSFGLVGSQQDIAHADAKFGKARGDAAEGGDASELRFRDEPRALLNLCQAKPRKDAYDDERRQRDGHEND